MSIYGSGNVLWRKFNAPCRLVQVDWDVFPVNLPYLRLCGQNNDGRMVGHSLVRE